MSTTARAQQLAFEAAERRVLENLNSSAGQRPSHARRLVVLAVAAVLFAVTFAARLAIKDPGVLIANFYVVPIALLAIEFGTRAGVLAAALALGLVFAWSALQTVHLGVLGYTARGAALLVSGAVVGRFSDRLRDDIAGRRRAQRHLSLYADQLERANQQLAQSVERLEAFAEIARAVGGETDLERVLSLILAHGREVVAARRLLVCLPEGEELVAVTCDARSGEQRHSEEQLRMPLRGSLAGEVLLSGRPLRAGSEDRPRRLDQLMPSASNALLVPLIFRGETLGVLVGIDRADGRAFGEEDEQLLMAVAASAATAVATARSVAAERLRLSIDAAEQARARWARELHDQTLQGLTGARMVLAAGLARDDPRALRRAAETADVHIGVEMRSLRDLITELRPAALDDLGLGPAIESLAKRQAAAAGFALDMSIEFGVRERPREIEDAIYRIVQEALSNVARHAKAEQATLRVRQLHRSVEVTVQDDGCGFVPGGPSEGFGLIGMRERADLLGGELSLSSAAGGPTRVTALLPLPA
ncbi:MAG TPA: GAF domain-containing sensor histidine kinase [Solirubrobacteraceae bacterium]|jgi:signal transduction histidine kinase|nr:GAF domain-containing sensor histidine kinase [Solirubrobacteraceae bacterium]